MKNSSISLFAYAVQIFIVFNAQSSVSTIYYPGPSPVDLNTAIEAANSTIEDDVIDLSGTIYIYDGVSTTLYGDADGAYSALPPIGSDFPGGAGKLSIINGAVKRSFSTPLSTPFRLVYIKSSAYLSLDKITLENGYVDNSAGGAIYNDINATLEIERSNISYNAVASLLGTPNPFGGAIYNAGIITSIHRSIIGGNSITTTASGPRGAGIYNGGFIFSIDQSTIADNTISLLNSNITALGGGIYNARFAHIDSLSNSTISGNNIIGDLLGTALNNVEGGGIFNSGTMSVFNSTIANNTLSADTALGGGINSDSAISINNNTISGNNCVGATSVGGGIYDIVNASFGVSTITSLVSNIIANNTAPLDSSDIRLSGDPPVEGYNLIPGTGFAGAWTPTYTDILITNLSQLDLGPLQDNGGITYTMALMPTSLAINNGHNPQGLTFDQRGTSYDRTIEAVADIGAFELQH